jgi:hypothetical protein
MPGFRASAIMFLRPADSLRGDNLPSLDMREVMLPRDQNARDET